MLASTCIGFVSFTLNRASAVCFYLGIRSSKGRGPGSLDSRLIALMTQSGKILT